MFQLVALVAATCAGVAGAMALLRADSAPAERARASAPALERCAASDVACESKALSAVALEDGPDAALAALRTRASGRDPVTCHMQAHAIGEAALEHYGDVAAAMGRGTFDCNSGYYHGVLVRAFVGVPDAELASQAERACGGGATAQTAATQASCVHGVGHGLAAKAGHGLDRAVSWCSSMRFRMSCYGGVFMEYLISYHRPGSPLYRSGDADAPCRAIDHRGSDAAGSCRWALGNTFALRRDEPVARQAAMCRTLPAAHRGTCVNAIGVEIAQRERADVGAILAACPAAAPDAVHCIDGAARLVVTSNAGRSEGRWRVEQATELCRRTPAALQRSCGDAVGLALRSIEAPSRAFSLTCTGMPGAARAACAAHAGRSAIESDAAAFALLAIRT